MESGLRNLVLIFLCGCLIGCFLEPGMKMESAPVTKRAVAVANIKPHFIPIDVPLIRTMHTYGKGKSYRIAPHDVLHIYVWEHPEFNRTQEPLTSIPDTSAAGYYPTSGYLVDNHGMIYFPLIGYLKASGKTMNQIRNDLAKRLTKYIWQPQIDVQVMGFRSQKIYVMGEVVKPGLQSLTDIPMSITDAINLAGGLNHDSADASHIFVIRGDYARPDVYWLNAKSPARLLLGERFQLQSHDVVFVSTVGVTRWNRVISQILPSIQTIWYTKDLLRRGI